MMLYVKSQKRLNETKNIYIYNEMRAQIDNVLFLVQIIIQVKSNHHINSKK